MGHRIEHKWETEWGPITYRAGNMDLARQASNAYHKLIELVPVPTKKPESWSGLMASFAINEIWEKNPEITYEDAEAIYVAQLDEEPNPNDPDYILKIDVLKGRAILAELTSLINQGCIVYGDNPEEVGFVLAQVIENNALELHRKIREVSEVTRRSIWEKIVSRRKVYEGEYLIDVWERRKPKATPYDLQDNMSVVADDLCVRFQKTRDWLLSLSIDAQCTQLAIWIEHTWYSWLRNEDERAKRDANKNGGLA